MEQAAGNGQWKAMPAFWDVVMDEEEAGKQVTREQVVELYDTWAKEGSYEKGVSLYGYGALDVLEKTIASLFPKDRASLSLLDVGACTGLAGQRLYKMGFRHIDALDPSSESLKVAREKGVYRTLFNVPMTESPLNIAQNSYDGVVLVGATGPKHLPVGAFTEMIRLVKSGGYIVNLMRAECLERCKDYLHLWEPMVKGHVTRGKWRLLDAERYKNHFIDRCGYKHEHVFQVC